MRLPAYIVGILLIGIFFWTVADLSWTEARYSYRAFLAAAGLGLAAYGFGELNVTEVYAVREGVREKVLYWLSWIVAFVMLASILLVMYSPNRDHRFMALFANYLSALFSFLIFGFFWRRYRQKTKMSDLN